MPILPSLASRLVIVMIMWGLPFCQEDFFNSLKTEKGFVENTSIHIINDSCIQFLTEIML